MIFVRWSAESRTLPTAEVDGFFGEVTDQVLLFAFETRHLEVENHGGHLSFKMVAGGEEVYHLDGRTISLQPGRVLLVNAGERYGSSIHRAHTRSVSVFLPTADVCAALAALTMPGDRLLEDPLHRNTSAVEVSQAPFRATETLALLMHRLAAATFAPTPPGREVLEALVSETASAALGADLRIVRRGAFHTCVRKGTRAELVARVVRARELIEDLHGRVSLAEMAGAACMSRYHFLRVFREATGLTPVAFARQVRLERGLAELRRTGSARRGARVAGFASVSTFLRAARRAGRG